MKELSTLITIQLINGSAANKYDFVADQPFILSPVNNNTAAGTTHSISQSITIDRISDAQAHLFAQTREGILTLMDIDHKPITIGSSDIPCKISVVQNLNTATLKVDYQGIEPIL